jgi:hypothetical protein
MHVTLLYACTQLLLTHCARLCTYNLPLYVLLNETGAWLSGIREAMRIDIDARPHRHKESFDAKAVYECSIRFPKLTPQQRGTTSAQTSAAYSSTASANSGSLSGGRRKRSADVPERFKNGIAVASTNRYSNGSSNTTSTSTTATNSDADSVNGTNSSSNSSNTAVLPFRKRKRVFGAVRSHRSTGYYASVYGNNSSSSTGGSSSSSGDGTVKKLSAEAAQLLLEAAAAMTPASSPSTTSSSKKKKSTSNSSSSALGRSNGSSSNSKAATATNGSLPGTPTAVIGRPQRSQSNTPKPVPAVGSRVEVYWPIDRVFYPG